MVDNFVSESYAIASSVKLSNSVAVYVYIYKGWVMPGDGSMVWRMVLTFRDSRHFDGSCSSVCCGPAMGKPAALFTVSGNKGGRGGV